MGLEIIILSEVRETNKRYHLYPLTCGILKNDTNEPFYKTEIDSQTSKTNSWLSKEKGVGKNELGINIHTAVAAKSLQLCPTLCDPIDTAAKSLQSCSTLCDPIDGSPPGPAVPGIL